MNHLNLGQSLLVMSSAGASWLMVRAGTAKKLLTTRDRPKCASCGRRMARKTCPCAQR
jgi:hypothetical protein